MQISKISQRTLAQSLLNMKQANFSFMLSHPLTWSELSKTYRDRFLILYLWLKDPNRMDKLTPLQRKLNSLKEAIPIESKYSLASTLKSSANRAEKKRVKLRQSQTESLRNSFEQNPYPSTLDIAHLAFELSLSPKKVHTWFIHQRQINKPTLLNKR